MHEPPSCKKPGQKLGLQSCKKEASQRELYFPVQVKFGEHPSQPYSECPSPHQRPAVSSKAAKPDKGKAGEDFVSPCSLPTLYKSQEQRGQNDWEEPRIIDLYTEECRQQSLDRANNK